MNTKRRAQPRTRDDLTTVHELKLAGHSPITPGVELTVTGIRGRVAFRSYTRNVERGVDWVDVIDRRGFARVVRPAAIARVHRTRRLGVSPT